MILLRVATCRIFGTLGRGCRKLELGRGREQIGTTGVLNILGLNDPFGRGKGGDRKRKRDVEKGEIQ